MNALSKTCESIRLNEYDAGKQHWLRWGPYLSERQWGTVREDYSANGDAWNYLPHDHARSRAYRWGEDGLAGISDKYQRLCFAPAFWNGNDPILKERLFGLSNPEGNHGEDVKELYYYLDSTPTHSYMRHLYKYPQAEFPYRLLVEENRRRGRLDPEFDLLDTGVFDENKYWDIFTEYAKAETNDILIRITVHNRGAEDAELVVLPTLWFRNQWSFGLLEKKPAIRLAASNAVSTQHEKLAAYHFYFEQPERILFTENETNTERLFNFPNKTPFVKDAFHEAVIRGKFEPFDTQTSGTKFTPLYRLRVAGGGNASIRLRLSLQEQSDPFDDRFEEILNTRKQEADEFYNALAPPYANEDLKNIQRQAFAGILWSKQYYCYDIRTWLKGDPGQPTPPWQRLHGRNSNWTTLNNEEIILMPDKWEYPWYAAWDLAFHCVPMAMIDPEFAKRQLILFLREWYMHPNGQLPAYEWALSDVNPPVHAWACLQVYVIDRERTGKGDVDFLKRVFQKLLINFTWWVNQRDAQGNNIFEGGFLGLDNIGVLDRSATLPDGSLLEQADGTAWMGLYCLNMLDMAIEIAHVDPSFEDVATKFFEHFTYIATSLNHTADDWPSPWDKTDGFYYDVLTQPNAPYIRLKVRSLVGLMPLLAVSVLPGNYIKPLNGFLHRMKWFVKNRYHEQPDLLQIHPETDDVLLALLPRDRFERIIQALLDESEFLGAGGIRSLSKRHTEPYTIHISGRTFSIQYEPGESETGIFGGNSNWRGPVWLPINYIITQALATYFNFYGPDCRIEFPTGSGKYINLLEAADRIAGRLLNIFTVDASGKRPVHGQYADRYASDPHFKDLLLFYEYFHGDTAAGLGASHQTGWTALIARIIDEVFNGRRQALEGLHSEEG